VKKFLLAIVVLFIAVPLLLLWLAGIPPRGIPEMAAVGTGLTAKLACSGYYLSGFSDDQNLEDIGTYNPAFAMIELRHETPDTVVADFHGVEARARYYPGLGCTLQYPKMQPLTALKMPASAKAQGPWPQGDNVPPPEADIQALLEQTLSDDNQQGLGTRALLVMQDNQVVAEAYAPGIGKDTPLLGWSMGKSLSALMVGRMEALGEIERTDDALFDDWLGDARREITVQNLLQMSTGLEFSEPYIPGNDSTRMLFTAASASEVALQSPLKHPPGSYWYYSSGTSNLLTRLVADRLGGNPQALLNFFAREIAGPLGLRNTTFELDASGVFVGSSYIYAPARDWARMALPLLNQGSVAGTQWLPAGWVKAASTPNGSANDGRYGYQFWLNRGGDILRWPELQDDAYAMMGNRGQLVMLFPSLNAAVVRLGWTAGSYPENDRLQPIQALLQAR
jgi:CubicO group peptidase (beta-lactamase class C family)